MGALKEEVLWDYLLKHTHGSEEDRVLFFIYFFQFFFYLFIFLTIFLYFYFRQEMPLQDLAQHTV